MKTIFFDNDGTLVDTEKLFFAATKTVLKEIGIDLTREWFITESLKKNLSAWTLVEGASDAEIQSLRKKRNGIYSELLHSDLELLPGVRETLDHLHGKVQMAVVTMSMREHFELILEKTGIAHYFDFFIVNEDVEKEKPYPDAYLLALETAKQKPENCIVIEDTERGVIAAKAAGLTVYAIPNELSKDNDFSQANGVLNSFSEILNLEFTS
ncbi:MAG: HAD superfamily hydrolase (TIGR01509 family) [Oceanicoccus sp.]|jgi:HAD superfamily hydrolase (TIGR01509 family)